MICLFPTPRRAAREQLSVCGARARVAAHSPPPFWGTARAGQLVSSTSFPEKQSTHSYPIPTMGYKRTNEDFPSSSAARERAEWSSFACFSLPKNRAPHFFRHIPNYAGHGRTDGPLRPAVPLRAGARRMVFFCLLFSSEKQSTPFLPPYPKLCGIRADRRTASSGCSAARGSAPNGFSFVYFSFPKKEK